MAVLDTVFHQIFQKLGAEFQGVVQVGKHLAVPGRKHLVHVLLSDVEDLGKLLVTGQAVHLGHGVDRLGTWGCGRGGGAKGNALRPSGCRRRLRNRTLGLDGSRYSLVPGLRGSAVRRAPTVCSGLCGSMIRRAAGVWAGLRVDAERRSPAVCPGLRDFMIRRASAVYPGLLAYAVHRSPAICSSLRDCAVRRSPAVCSGLQASIIHCVPPICPGLVFSSIRRSPAISPGLSAVKAFLLSAGYPGPAAGHFQVQNRTGFRAVRHRSHGLFPAVR